MGSRAGSQALIFFLVKRSSRADDGAQWAECLARMEKDLGSFDGADLYSQRSEWRQSGDRVETGGPGVQGHLWLHRELKASQAT